MGEGEGIRVNSIQVSRGEGCEGGDVVCVGEGCEGGVGEGVRV